MGEYTSTEVNAKNFKIPASKKSGNLAKAVPYSAAENFTALKTKSMKKQKGFVPVGNSHLPSK